MFEYCKKNATGVLVVVVLVIVAWTIYRREAMCGGCDQQCTCCGYETFARGSNERLIAGGQNIATLGDSYPERMIGGGGHIATLGDSYPERMMGRPILYDDLLRQVGQGTV